MRPAHICFSMSLIYPKKVFSMRLVIEKWSTPILDIKNFNFSIYKLEPAFLSTWSVVLNDSFDNFNE